MLVAHVFSLYVTNIKHFLGINLINYHQLFQNGRDADGKIRLVIFPVQNLSYYLSFVGEQIRQFLTMW